MKAAILFQSRKKNRYRHDRILKQTSLTHPLLFFLLELHQNGVSPETWRTKQDRDPVVIENYGTFSRSDIDYYCQKFLFLKNNGCLEELDNRKQLSLRVSATDVEKALANARQVTFEVTDACNLECRYCGYGSFYCGNDSRAHNRMDPSVAAKLLSWLAELWRSPLNQSNERMIYLSFYGGEPLLETGIIREIMTFSRQLPLPPGTFVYSMTTNGTLLDKYMDFLAENDFRLLISLDGDEAHNSHRVYKNGASSFAKIYDNIIKLRAKYPKYFQKNVSFNTVMHNKNTVPAVFHFFRTHFNKTPALNALNTTGVSREQKEAFWKTYANIEDSLFSSEDYPQIEQKMFTALPNIRSVSVFLHQFTDFSFNDYPELMGKQEAAPCRFPTGACLPFTQKIFMTVKGNLLACERISQEHVLGVVDGEGVKLDFAGTAAYYNKCYDMMLEQCQGCYNSDHCAQCMFNLDLTGGAPVCRGLMNREEYGAYLASFIDYLEAKPGMFGKILDGVVLE